MFELFSEPYSATGSVAADGAKRLLGAPDLSRLEILVRETVQNSWDARNGKGAVEYSINLSIQSEQLVRVLREEVFRELPKDASSAKALTDSIRKGAGVMAISDRNTVGLGGPLDPQIVPEEDSRTDFIDFVRNIGSRRGRKGGGGTYGFGKTASYAFSQCSTIIIASRTHDERGALIYRLIACQIGSEFSHRDENGIGKRYTGRHWWGVKTDEGVDPVEGEEAERLAKRLGIDFSDGDTGTTLLVIDPYTDVDESSVGNIAEALLWHCWPKMIPQNKDDAPPMLFSLALEGTRQKIPDPSITPPFNLLVDALKSVRMGKDGSAKRIECRSPVKTLGYLATSRGKRLPRRNLVPPDQESLIPQELHHVALMRPVELVVRYMTEEKYAGESIEWGGVFVVSSDPEVEEAFAAAEPPTHDDWQAKQISDPRQKRFVRVGLRRIGETLGGSSDSAPAFMGRPESVPLARIADRLGALIPSTRGDRRGVDRPKPSSRSTKSGPASNRKRAALDFYLSNVYSVRGGVERTFEINRGERDSAMRALVIGTSIVIEGRPQKPGYLEDGDSPIPVGWFGENGDQIVSGARIDISHLPKESRLFFKVFFPNDVVSEINVSAELH